MLYGYGCVALIFDRYFFVCIHGYIREGNLHSERFAWKLDTPIELALRNRSLKSLLLTIFLIFHNVLKYQNDIAY